MRMVNAVVSALLVLVLISTAVPGQASDRATLRSDANLNVLAGEYVRSQKAREMAIEKALEGHALHEALQAKIEEEVDPGVMIRLFLKEISKLRAAGMSEFDLAEKLNRVKREGVETSYGSISGYVTVDGNPREVFLLAFDEYGMYASSSYASYYDGYYSFWLPEGKYYIMTFSEIYVDEFYDNIPAFQGSFENWRDATQFDLTGETSYNDINFDLQDGVHISGIVTGAYGDTLEYEDLIFTITSTTSPEPIFSYESYIRYDNTYVLNMPMTGTFKFHLEVELEGGKWYNNKDSWEEADPLTVSTPGDTLRGIDFALGSGSGDNEFAGSVRKGDGSGSMDFALVAAFNLADTSLAGLGITIFGSYGITGLPDGDYILYADDMVGYLFDEGNWVGEYYEDAHTPGEATVVTLSEANRRVRVDFTLDSGGAISGTVLGPGSTPIDSIFVLVGNADILDFDPFFSNVVVTIGLTDADGHFFVSGLPTGEYLLRTFTPGEYELDLWFWYFYVPGTHYGTVVDEYYGGIQDLFSIDSATRVSVTAPNTTEGIDFTLDPAGAVSGVVQDAVEGFPVEEVYVFALDPETMFPQLAYGFSEWQEGRYVLSPLPAGEYVITALFLVESEYEENPFLSEYYDGVTIFEDATPVTVVPPDTTKSIDFTIDKGALIRGHVYLEEGYPAGADSLWYFPIAVYDAGSGEMITLGWATFSGGFEIPKVPAGTYKLCALPGFYSYAATYYGGGATFDDADAVSFTVAAGDTFLADIVLDTAGGSISGFVHKNRSGEPLNSSLVIAYDQTGHAAGLGFAGFDWQTEEELNNNGAYAIQGLRPGTYHVRSWAIFSLLLEYRYLFDDWYLDLDDLDPFALLEIVFGVDFGSDAYGDRWYPDVYIPFTEYDLIDIAIDGLLYGITSQYDPVPFTFFAPFPFYQELQGQAITISGSSERSGIDFGLSPLDPEEILDVEETDHNGSLVPEEYVLQQNYPNPFNPETDISYQLSAVSGQTTHHTTLNIYNVLGQVIRTLVDEMQKPGYYTVTWDGRDNLGVEAPSGMYFYRITANDFSSIKRMVLMK